MNPKEQVQREEIRRGYDLLTRRFAKMVEEAGERIRLPGWPTGDDVPVNPDWDGIEAGFRAISVSRLPEDEMQELRRRIGGVCLALMAAIPEKITPPQVERILAILDRLLEHLDMRMNLGTVQ